EGCCGDRLDHLAVARVLGRLVARPRGHSLAEDLDVPLDARARALDGFATRLGDVAMKRALNLLGARRAAGFAPRLAIGAHHVAHPGYAADIGDHHHVVTAAPGPDERLDGGHRGDPDGRMGLLDRPRVQVDVAKPVKLALIGHAVLGPEARDDVDALLEAGAALVHRDAEHLELLRNEGAAEADVEPAVAEVVE